MREDGNWRRVEEKRKLTSTVGFPRLSKMVRALMALMVAIVACGRCEGREAKKGERERDRETRERGRVCGRERRQWDPNNLMRRIWWDRIYLHLPHHLSKCHVSHSSLQFRVIVFICYLLIPSTQCMLLISNYNGTANDKNYTNFFHVQFSALNAILTLCYKHNHNNKLILNLGLVMLYPTSDDRRTLLMSLVLERCDYLCIFHWWSIYRPNIKEARLHKW